MSRDDVIRRGMAAGRLLSDGTVTEAGTPSEASFTVGGGWLLPIWIVTPTTGGTWLGAAPPVSRSESLIPFT